MIQNEVWIILEQGEPLKGQAFLRVCGRMAMVSFLAVWSYSRGLSLLYLQTCVDLKAVIEAPKLRAMLPYTQTSFRPYRRPSLLSYKVPPKCIKLYLIPYKIIKIV